MVEQIIVLEALKLFRKNNDFWFLVSGITKVSDSKKGHIDSWVQPESLQSIYVFVFVWFCKHLQPVTYFMAPFYGWGSTTSRLELLQGGSLLYASKFPEIPGTHFIDLGSMKGWFSLGATQWFYEPFVAHVLQ